MPAVRSLTVGCLETSCVRQRQDALQPLYVGNCFLDIHTASVSDAHADIIAARNGSFALPRLHHSKPEQGQATRLYDMID